MLKHVIDGDSIKLQNGRELRYVGINAPEWDHPGGAEAKAFNEKHLNDTPPAKRRFVRCTLQNQDAYGRILGFVELDKQDLQEKMLEAGLAVPMVIEPCGRLRVQQYERAAAKARQHQSGLWKELLSKKITAMQAKNNLKEYRAVSGTVASVHQGKKAWHLNFGKNWKRDFSVTIFTRDLADFKKNGMTAETLKGKSITVYGYIQNRYGPQIIAYSPAQIEMD